VNGERKEIARKKMEITTGKERERELENKERERD